MPTVYRVARSTKYVLVLRWTQVWPVSNLFLFNTSGIRAAAENPQRIRSGTDAAGSKLQQVFRQKNLSLYSVHGRTLYNMPAGIFCALLVTSERTRMSVVFGRSESAVSKLVVEQHTGRYAIQQAISKRLFLQYTAHLLRCFSDRMSVLLPGSTNKNYKLLQFFMIYLK